MADLLGIDLPYEVDGASAVSDPDTSGTKRYQRLQNPFQAEPDALLDIDTATNYRPAAGRPLARGGGRRTPSAAFYRRYPLGGLYGRPSTDLTVGEPAGTAELDQLDAVRRRGRRRPPAYLGGQIDLDGAGDRQAWVVVAVDGVVQGFSRLFPMLDTEPAFSILLDQDVVGRRAATRSTSTSLESPPAPSTPSTSRDRPLPDRSGVDLTP